MCPEVSYHCSLYHASGEPVHTSSEKTPITKRQFNCSLRARSHALWLSSEGGAVQPREERRWSSLHRLMFVTLRRLCVVVWSCHARQVPAMKSAKFPLRPTPYTWVACISGALAPWVLPVTLHMYCCFFPALYMPWCCLSVRLSSVTFRCFVETNEATIMRFSPAGRTFILVSEEIKIVWKFARDHP